jgi:hypothetical protein
MVKTRRRQLALLAALLAIGALLWYWSAGRRPAAASPSSRAGSAEQPLAIADVPRIGLDRLAQLRADDDKEPQDDDDSETVPGGAARGAAAPALHPTPQAVEASPVAAATPAEPALPPMNVRYIGAVEVRSGVWVASMLNDHKDLLTGKEGDIIGNRYRIVKIGIESIDLLETASGRQRRVRLGGS